MTATASPVGSRARWTWPIDAEATGSGENSANSSVGAAAAELLAQARLDVPVGPRRHLVLQALQLLAELVGQEVGHDADELADFDEQAPQPEDGGLDAARVASVLGEGQALDGLRAGESGGRCESPKYDSATRAVTK